jgi:hypothetical protein
VNKCYGLSLSLLGTAAARSRWWQFRKTYRLDHTFKFYKTKQNMKNMTSREFIENVNFKYFVTYSFQRTEESDMYEILFSRYSNDNNSLTEEEYRKLRSSSKRGGFIFTDDNYIHQMAELIYSSDNSSSANDELIEIMKTPFVDYDAWMCAPIYREAILFYDYKNQLIDGLNICFECCNVINLKRKNILTDRYVYERLKGFLESVGHRID